MLNVRINKDLEKKLNKIALVTDRSKSYITKLALENYLSEMEFLLEAQNRYNDPNAEYVDYDEFKRKFNKN